MKRTGELMVLENPKESKSRKGLEDSRSSKEINGQETTFNDLVSDVVYNIFSWLSLADFVKCLFVSKYWKATIHHCAIELIKSDETSEDTLQIILLRDYPMESVIVIMITTLIEDNVFNDPMMDFILWLCEAKTSPYVGETLYFHLCFHGKVEYLDRLNNSYPWRPIYTKSAYPLGSKEGDLEIECTLLFRTSSRGHRSCLDWILSKQGWNQMDREYILLGALDGKQTDIIEWIDGIFTSKPIDLQGYDPIVTKICDKHPLVKNWLTDRDYKFPIDELCENNNNKIR